MKIKITYKCFCTEHGTLHPLNDCQNCLGIGEKIYAEEFEDVISYEIQP